MFRSRPEGAPARERGAAATLVAILAAGGVLLGMLALTVDVGNMMFERRQLQNGADASAMALAQICAEDLADCDPTLTVGNLSALNSANAYSDGEHGLGADGRATELNGQCGRAPGAPNMPWCDSATEPAADIADLSQCPALPPWLAAAPDIPYVEVYSRSQSSIGPALDFFFREGDATIVNCARAAWGAGMPAAVLPFTINECEWENATGGGDTFGEEVAIALNYKDKDYCGGDIGRDYDGGFGWLSHLTNVCEVELDEDSWVEGTQGMGKGTDCVHLLSPGARVLIPINDCINKTRVMCDPLTTGPGSEYYHIAGFGAFEVTGYKLPSSTALSGVGSAALAQCSSDYAAGGHCIYGRFVTAFAGDGDIITDPDHNDYGIKVVKPAG